MLIKRKKREEKKITNIIISGKKHFGKTTTALRLSELLKQEQILIGGVLSVGNDLLDVATGNKTVFMYDLPMPETIHTGHHYLLKPALRHGEELIKQSLQQHTYTFIDECGKLELERKEGFYNVLNYALPHGKCIVCVRDANVEKFFDVFSENKQTTHVFEVNETNKESIPHAIFSYITQSK